MASKRRVMYDLNPLNIVFTPVTDAFQASGSKGKSAVSSSGKRVGIYIYISRLWCSIG